MRSKTTETRSNDTSGFGYFPLDTQVKNHSWSKCTKLPVLELGLGDFAATILVKLWLSRLEDL